eukprot:TRINITY_DN101360_c0_g1_i1.p1 TRINITY_DN101360_c0_g1~~TRINITY_DN101360_c0_g1_i1.p1  ORF type:complete len:695 (+),score=189.23 TRINITY_DN101360_c0_g1_i1:71-2155(+)
MAARPQSVSMDWPLSRAEKRAVVMNLYERDVRTADKMLQSREEEVTQLQEEVKTLRRMSFGSVASSTRCSTGGDDDDMPSTLERTPKKRLSTAEMVQAVREERWRREDAEGEEEEEEEPANAKPAEDGEAEQVQAASLEASKQPPETRAHESKETLQRTSQEAQDGARLMSAVLEQQQEISKRDRRAGSRAMRSHSVGSYRDAPRDEQVERRAQMRGITECDEEPEDEVVISYEVQPCTEEEMGLRVALENFYKRRRIEGKAEVVDRVARRHTLADSVPELWAHIGKKYMLAAPVAAQWLAVTLGPVTPVQWSKDSLPEAVREALRDVAGRRPRSSTAAADLVAAKNEVLHSALQEGSIDVVRALAFRNCPKAMRPAAWRLLLGVAYQGTALEERRGAYRQLRARAVESSPRPAGYGTCADPLREEIEADVRKAWNGEAFMQQEGILEAVTAVTLTVSVRHNRYVRGSCEIAALLLHVFVEDGAEELSTAEADAFWGLSSLLKELQGSILDDAALDVRTRRVHSLLHIYDPALAELLEYHNLSALPATRLGVALCTRAGFSLRTCTLIWDALLADPRRFEFCDYLVVSLLFLNRHKLVHNREDPGAMAEVLLAAPRSVEQEGLLKTAYAVCAFERRCNADSSAPFPERPGLLDTIAASTVSTLGSLWGRVRTRAAPAAARAASRLRKVGRPGGA